MIVPGGMETKETVRNAINKTVISVASVVKPKMEITTIAVATSITNNLTPLTEAPRNPAGVFYLMQVQILRANYLSFYKLQANR
jgi:hypothetical protein